MNTRIKVTNERLCAAIITQGTIRKAAEYLQISERTIYKKMQEQDFKTLYMQAQTDILNRCLFELQNNMIRAVKCITEVMNDPEASPQTRLNAAQLILKNITVMYEIRDKRQEQTEDIW